tara:strand:- start:10 stop:249 length:240 start_codon:yes stop_codon:yes gene_type:complete
MGEEMITADLNAKTFSMQIEELVCELKVPYMDAIVHYCERNDLEIETAAKLINNKIKQSIASEASDLNMMKEKIQKLPV